MLRVWWFELTCPVRDVETMGFVSIADTAAIKNQRTASKRRNLRENKVEKAKDKKISRR